MKLRAIPLLLLLASCASDVPDYYTLATVGGPQVSDKKFVIEVQKPGVDEAIDVPQMVKEDNGGRTLYDNKALWSEPLANMVERVVAEDLAQRLPGSSVVTASGDTPVRPQYLVAMDIRKFGINKKGDAAIEIMVAINTPSAPGKSQLATFAESVPGTAVAKVHSLSGLLAALSDQIARDIASRQSD